MTVDPGLQNYLVMPVPDPFHPQVLFEQLEDAGLVPEPEFEGGQTGVPSEFYRSMDELIFTHLATGQEDVVQPLLDAHPPLAQAQLDAEQAEVNNEITLRDRAIQAMASNRADIQQGEAWLTNNPTANPVLQELTRQSVFQAKQLNAIYRLMFQKFDGTD